MKYSDQVKPISYLKSHAASIVSELSERETPTIITQNGEARMVVQDIRSYEQTQENALLISRNTKDFPSDAPGTRPLYTVIV